MLKTDILMKSGHFEELNIIVYFSCEKKRHYILRVCPNFRLVVLCCCAAVETSGLNAQSVAPLWLKAVPPVAPSLSLGFAPSYPSFIPHSH